MKPWMSAEMKLFDDLSNWYRQKQNEKLALQNSELSKIMNHPDYGKQKAPSESALKPCPFCGGNAHLEPELYSEDNASEVIGPASVTCMVCGCTVWGDWSDDAIDAWERREASTNGQ